MSRQNSQAIAEIKKRINLADVVSRYVDLRRVGPRFVAPCPFHQETKPSFSVNEEEGLFYCFGCQASGDLFDFYGRINGLDFRESLEHLAEEAGINLAPLDVKEQANKSRQISNRKQILRMHELAAKHYARNLNAEKGKLCREYLQNRGLNQEIIDSFQLGFSFDDWQDLAKALKAAGFEDHAAVEGALLGKKESRVYDRFRSRLMFPIRNLSGQVIAFGGRIIGNEDEAKYINSGDSPVYKKGEHLYGLYQARRAMSHGAPALLTEGYMDVLTLHQFGYTTAIGVLGTALTTEQVRRLSGFTSSLELLFDGDRAGNKAALRACEMFITKGLSCKVIILPQGEDIDSLLRTQGKEAFEKLRQSGLEGIHYCVHALRQVSPKEAIEFTKNFLKQCLPELVARYLSILATGLNLTESELRGQLSRPESAGKQKINKPVEIIDLLDKQIMTVAVRYPSAIGQLRELGAHLVLSSSWAKTLWAQLEENQEEIVSFLSDQNKKFWVACRTGNVPPLNNEQGELSAISQLLKNKQRIVSATTTSNVLNKLTNDYEADHAYLKALAHTLKKQNTTM